MNDAEFQKLLETSWRRKLTAAEGTALNEHLAANADARVLWEEETGLNQAIGKLPDAPVPTNFTARVLQEIGRETVHSGRREHGFFHWLRSNWFPRIAVASLVVFGGVLSIQQHQRAELADDIKAVSNAATVPQLWLEDFDAINRLNQPPIDNELLAALQ